MPDIQTIASILATPQSSSSTYLTDEEKKRLLAYELLQKQASSTNTPIYSTTAGLMKLATGALGGYLEGKTERDALAAQAKNGALISQWANLLSGGGDSGTTPQAAVTPPSVDTSDIPASPVDAPPMGALPGMAGSVAADNKIYDPGEMSPLDAAVATPQELAAVPGQDGIYPANVLNPLDAAVASPVEKYRAAMEIKGPPPPALSTAPVQPAPSPIPMNAPTATPLGAETLRDFDAMSRAPMASPGTVSPMAFTVAPGDMDRGTIFNPSLPGGLSEGSTILPNAAVKPVPVGPNGEVSTLAPSSLMANDPPPRPPADIPNPMGQYANAISGIESGGRYSLLGPVTKNGDRAVGKYQVMASNVPEWTKEALGRPMTPAEFRADPQAQEAVFAHKFGSYVQKYGPEGAAKAWFAGEGGMNNPNARDVLGTSVSSYANQFRKNLGPAGAQVASLDPSAGVGVAASQPPAGGPPAQSGPTPQRLAQALQNPPQVNQDAQRRAIAARLLADPRTPPKIRALVVQQMTPQNQIMQLPDGTILSVDKRTNSVAPIYRAAPKPVVVNNRLVDPSTGKVVADFSDPKATNDIQNYNFYAQQEAAAGRTPLPYGQWDIQRRRSGATNVNTGTIPAGYEQFTGPDGAIQMRPIPGGPKDTTKQDQQKADAQSISSDVVINAAKLARKALDSSTLPAAGTASRPLSYIGETGAAELRRQIDVLRSNASIETLNQMRQQSKTGGALGSVTEGEERLLANKSGAIDPTAPPAQVKAAIDDYERTLLRVVHGKEAGDKIYNQTHGAAADPLGIR